MPKRRRQSRKRRGAEVSEEMKRREKEAFTKRLKNLSDIASQSGAETESTIEYIATHMTRTKTIDLNSKTNSPCSSTEQGSEHVTMRRKRSYSSTTSKSESNATSRIKARKTRNQTSSSTSDCRISSETNRSLSIIRLSDEKAEPSIPEELDKSDSTLPDLIIERVPPKDKHDDPPEFYEELHRKVMMFIRRKMIKRQDITGVSIDELGDDGLTRAASRALARETSLRPPSDQESNDSDASLSNLGCSTLQSYCDEESSKSSVTQHMTVTCQADVRATQAPEDDFDSKQSARRQSDIPETDNVSSSEGIEEMRFQQPSRVISSFGNETYREPHRDDSDKLLRSLNVTMEAKELDRSQESQGARNDQSEGRNINDQVTAGHSNSDQTGTASGNSDQAVNEHSHGDQASLGRSDSQRTDARSSENHTTEQNSQRDKASESDQNTEQCSHSDKVRGLRKRLSYSPVISIPKPKRAKSRNENIHDDGIRIHMNRSGIGSHDQNIPSPVISIPKSKSVKSRNEIIPDDGLRIEMNKSTIESHAHYAIFGPILEELLNRCVSVSIKFNRPEITTNLGTEVCERNFRALEKEDSHRPHTDKESGNVSDVNLSNLRRSTQQPDGDEESSKSSVTQNMTVTCQANVHATQALEEDFDSKQSAHRQHDSHSWASSRALTKEASLRSRLDQESGTDNDASLSNRRRSTRQSNDYEESSKSSVIQHRIVTCQADVQAAQTQEDDFDSKQSAHRRHDSHSQASSRVLAREASLRPLLDEKTGNDNEASSSNLGRSTRQSNGDEESRKSSITPQHKIVTCQADVHATQALEDDFNSRQSAHRQHDSHSRATPRALEREASLRPLFDQESGNNGENLSNAGRSTRQSNGDKGPSIPETDHVSSSEEIEQRRCRQPSRVITSPGNEPYIEHNREDDFDELLRSLNINTMETKEDISQEKSHGARNDSEQTNKDTDQISEGRSKSDQSYSCNSKSDQTGAVSSNSDQAVTEHSHSDQAETEHSHSDQAVTEHSHNDQVVTEHSHSDQAETEHSHSNQAEHSHSDQAVTEHSHSDQASSGLSHNQTTDARSSTNHTNEDNGQRDKVSESRSQTDLNPEQRSHSDRATDSGKRPTISPVISIPKPKRAKSSNENVPDDAIQMQMERSDKESNAQKATSGPVLEELLNRCMSVSIKFSKPNKTTNLETGQHKQNASSTNGNKNREQAAQRAISPRKANPPQSTNPPQNPISRSNQNERYRFRFVRRPLVIRHCLCPECPVNAMLSHRRI